MAGRSKSKSRKGALAVRPSAGAFERLQQALVDCAVDPRAARQLVTRLEGRPLSPEGRLKLDDVELLALIDDRLARAFQNLDDFALGQSSARDLTVSIGVLTDKRRLLKPEDGPVQRFKDMKKLDEVFKALIDEGLRRGLLVGVTPAPAEASVAIPETAVNGEAKA